MNTEELEEIKHFLEVATSFQEYSIYAGREIYRRKSHLEKLSSEHKARLPQKTFRKIEALQAALIVNQRFLSTIVENQQGFGPCPIPPFQVDPSGRVQTSGANQSKMRTTLQMCVRDWSAEGAIERDATYGPILEELQARLPAVGGADGPNRRRVLCPGVGLGRLALEIVARGYACQGNEFSYQMLMASNYLLNSVETAGSHAIFPFIENPNNSVQIKDMLRKITIPDKTPNEILADIAQKLPEGEFPDFSMTAGEFLEIYGDQVAEWDALVTCFFVDTAVIPMDYCEAIWRLLKPGGYWINLGPLLYHWAGARGEDLGPDLDVRYTRSVELSWEELSHVIGGYGFQILQTGFRELTYTGDPRSMMRTVYNALFFTAQKPAAAAAPPPTPAARGEEGGVPDAASGLANSHGGGHQHQHHGC
mmetsp:Transcript_12381/g.22129  ORF Transcript_12381/g.22129 Transcript_12381/m.22129 type:complete len:421 (+) Transcript_12381:52-1314(+)